MIKKFHFSFLQFPGTMNVAPGLGDGDAISGTFPDVWDMYGIIFFTNNRSLFPEIHNLKDPGHILNDVGKQCEGKWHYS